MRDTSSGNLGGWYEVTGARLIAVVGRHGCGASKTAENVSAPRIPRAGPSADSNPAPKANTAPRARDVLKSGFRGLNPIVRYNPRTTGNEVYIALYEKGNMPPEAATRGISRAGFRHHVAGLRHRLSGHYRHLELYSAQTVAYRRRLGATRLLKTTSFL